MSDKYVFAEGERVIFYFNYDGKDLTAEEARISEIEEEGVWVEFDRDPENEYLLIQLLI